MSTRDPTFVKRAGSEDEDCFSQADMNRLLQQLKGEIIERTKVTHNLETAQILHDAHLLRATNTIQSLQLEKKCLEEQLADERTKRIALENKNLFVALSKKLKNEKFHAV